MKCLECPEILDNMDAMELHHMAHHKGPFLPAMYIGMRCNVTQDAVLPPKPAPVQKIQQVVPVSLSMSFFKYVLLLVT
jgi:hypothetical protein